MPIKTLGLRTPRAPRLGVIRLGVKEVVKTRGGNDREIPKEVAYFVVPDEVKRAVGEEKPTRLQVLLPSDDPDQVLSAWFTRYAGKLLVVKCDGETCVEIPKDGKRGEHACLMKYDEGSGIPQGCECGATAQARLNVLLLNARLGIYQVVIGGHARINNLMAEIALAKRMFGRLTGIVFEIERRPEEVQIEKEDGGRLARTGWPVHLNSLIGVRDALEASGQPILALGEADAPPTVGRAAQLAPAGARTVIEHEAEQHAAHDEEDREEPGEQERLVDDLWTVFLDAAGGKHEQALKLARSAVAKHVGRPVENLGDLSLDEAQKLALALRPEQQGRLL